jgi:hypothetical protein
MSDPSFALVLIFGFLVLLTLVSYFKTLERDLWIAARHPLIAGAICGAVILYVKFVPPFFVAGVLLTLAALYVRLTGSESEPADGMILGAITGASASLPLVVFSREHELLRVAECLLAGAVSGYGITFGLTHVRDKTRQAGVDAITAVLGVLAAWLPALFLRIGRITERQIAIAAASLVPIAVVATVFKQWPSVRAELRHEAALGFIDEDDVRTTAHPLLRFGRAGWHDAEAHRSFVRIANQIALRKRQQRTRTEDVARLYQLEVIKLRMQMQEMTAIDRRMRTDSSQPATMPGE